ncbi:MAG: hypothetical protein H9535_11810 [Ignavibacteria bacterium]|nr:hypothetical protein [Ignavibacteria bacterium]
MNTRDFKLYILKTLGVASLMALGAVFLVLAATFTSSKSLKNYRPAFKIYDKRWEYNVDIDRFFPKANDSFARRFGPKPNLDIHSCPPYVFRYLIRDYNPTGIEYIVWNEPMTLGLVAAEKAGISYSTIQLYYDVYHRANFKDGRHNLLNATSYSPAPNYYPHNNIYYGLTISEELRSKVFPKSQ